MTMAAAAKLPQSCPTLGLQRVGRDSVTNSSTMAKSKISLGKCHTVLENM